MYVTAVPNRASPPAILLRESYRQDGKVKNRTIANITSWPPPRIALFRRLLAGELDTAGLPEPTCGPVFGLLHALESIATLLLMCDARDLGTAIGERPPSPGSEIEWEEAPELREVTALAEKEFFEPNLYLYDAYPGGIGFSEPLFRTYSLLLAKTREMISACPCENGCPSCVGPVGERGERAKEAALAILSRLGA